MYDIIAIVLEVFIIIIISNFIYVNKIRLSTYPIILAFSILYAVINQYMTDISPIYHYMIYTAVVLFVHIEEQKWVAPFAALMGYAGLIYLQVICLRWFSTEWVSKNYELFGLAVNLIVFAVTGIIHFSAKRIGVDVQYNHLKWWQIIASGCIAIGVIVFCYVYKPILETQYYIDSYVWLCFVGVVLFAVLVIERQSSRIKDKQVIKELQRRIDIEYSYRHDYEKQLRLLDGADKQFVDDFLKENEQGLCFDRLPEYPKKVIESYLTEFQQKGIIFKLEVPEPIMQWSLSLKDTISVLGNLIENSIEAVEDVPSHKKWIEIAFTNIPDSDSLQLCISNPSFKRNRLKEKS